MGHFFAPPVNGYPLSPEQGITALEQLWTNGNLQTTVAKVNWSIFKQLYEIGGRRLLLEEIEVEPLINPLSNAHHKTEIEQRLKASDSTEREQLLISYFQEVISQVLWMNASEIDVQQPLNRMGIDSLMAIELRDRLQTDLAVNVPIVKFIEDICIVDLATEVNGQMTQIKNIQINGLENNKQTILSDANNIDWVEGEL